jgi:ribosome-associated protein
MTAEELRDIARAALEDMKAVDITVLDVRKVSSITDYMLVASGTSDRHVRSVTDAVVEKAREHGVRALGVEGETHAQWALVDLGDVIVHVMRPEVRAFYQLEKLWGFDGGETGSGTAR